MNPYVLAVAAAVAFGGGWATRGWYEGSQEKDRITAELRERDRIIEAGNRRNQELQDVASQANEQTRATGAALADARRRLRERPKLPAPAGASANCPLPSASEGVADSGGGIYLGPGRQERVLDLGGQGEELRDALDSCQARLDIYERKQ